MTWLDRLFRFRHPISVRLLIEATALPGPFRARVSKKCRRASRRYAKRHFRQAVGRLRPGDIALDLGANLGVYTEDLAASGATVHAFEPNPALAARLRDRFLGWENVMVHEAAVGGRTGRAELHLIDDYSAETLSGSMSSSLVFQPERMALGRRIDVEVVDLFSFLRELPRRPTLIKMDIEGAEWDILDRLLGAVPPLFEFLFVELHGRFVEGGAAAERRLRRRSMRLGSAYANLGWR